MESDHDHQPPSDNNPTDGDEQGASHVTSKSYECNFCKRGFSNAQALGGHMNIHRRDKAKLKQQQTSHQTQPSLDKVPPLDQTKSGEESCKPNWNWSVPQQELASSRDDAIHMRQLPLFAESPTSSETQKPQGQTTTERTLISSQDLSTELDLELRLGSEPQDSSAATGTRKFF